MIYPLLPSPICIQGRSYFANWLADLSNWASGNYDPDVPPKHLNISGDGPFRELGHHNLMLCRELGHLNAADTVLDLGCGIGRTAIAMKDFLSSQGSYVGIDIIRFAIRWCRRRIARRHRNFSFLHVNVYNRTYNPRGTLSPDRCSFPLPAASFTFCLATSLFTHLLPSATENYIREISVCAHRKAGFFQPGSCWTMLHPKR